MLFTLIYIVLICGVAALAFWAIDQLNTPQPIRNIVRVLVIIVALFVIVGLVMGLFGMATDVKVPMVVK